MTNHEVKEYADAVHVYMAFSRTKDGQKHATMRQVVKDPEIDLKVLETRCLERGGIWRIHKTVNQRDTEKARLWLIHKLIDFPEGRGFVDSLWRTALLQVAHIHGEKKFMLDVDTKNPAFLETLNGILMKTIPMHLLEITETPNGYHMITPAFDTREVCKLPYVSLQRDGYVYIKTVGEVVK
jgi:hypothetical protein